MGSNAQIYLDRVRNRAGLITVPATLENIKSERKYELAFEFSRFYDLMRWGDVEKEFAF
jgi:starch-binding outer membrane protein, SusD/RagB family